MTSNETLANELTALARQIEQAVKSAHRYNPGELETHLGSISDKLSAFADGVDPGVPAPQISRDSADLMVVAWDGQTRRWQVDSRPEGSADWVTHEGDEGELDTLLSLARDVVTGG